MKGYSKLEAADFSKTAGDKLRKDEADQYLFGLIPERLNGFILDLCCGNGKYSDVLCIRGAEMVVSMDASIDMLTQVENRQNEKALEQICPVQADMRNLPIKYQSFDFILFRHGLAYEPNTSIAGIMLSLRKSLKKGGVILIATGIIDIDGSITNEKRESVQNKPVPLILQVGDQKVELGNYPITTEDYSRAFHEAGLKVDACRYFPPDGVTIKEGYEFEDNITALSAAVFQLSLTFHK